MDRQGENNQLSYLLKNKLADRSFEYKEEYWMEAEQLIILDEQKRHIPVWWMWGPSLILALKLSRILMFNGVKHVEDKVASTIVTDSNKNHDESNCSFLFNGALFPDNSASESNSGLDISEIIQPPKINQGQYLSSKSSCVGYAKKNQQNNREKKLILPLEDQGNTVEIQSKDLLPINPDIKVDLMAERYPLAAYQEYNAREPKWKFGVQVGWNRFEWKNPTEQLVTNDWSPHVGIYAKYRLEKGLELIGAVSYFSTDRFSPDAEFRSEEISFGLVSQLTRYELQQLHYLDIPVSIRKHVGTRHSIQASLHHTLLLRTQHHVSEIIENAFGQSTNSDQGLQIGSKQGLNRLTLGIGVAYRFRFTPNLRLGLDTRVYPSHLFQEDFYHVDRSSPWMISLQLEYDLFKIR